MNTLILNGRSVTSSWEVKDVCKIVMLCEDALAHDRAMKVLNLVSAIFERQVAVTIMCWDFEQQGHERGENCTAQASTSADLILFSMRDGNFPASLGAKPGISWPWTNKPEGCVAYLRTKPAHLATEEVITALKHVARQSGVDVLPLTAEPGSPKVQLFNAGDWTTTATRKELDRPHYEHWGLNE